MRILIDIGHPAHVHLYKSVYYKLINKGRVVLVTVKDIPAVKQLLSYYSIPFINLGTKSDNLKNKFINQLKYDWLLRRIITHNKIDIGIGSSITLAHVSRISKMKSIIFDDDDSAVQPLMAKFGHPYADSILSPDVLKYEKKKKTIYYSGYHELAYLHPNRFTPNINVLEELGIKPNETFFIMRFNVFKAHHDVGIHGLNIEQKLKLIDLLEPYGKIFITTEREIEPELKKYQLPVSPEKIHSLLYYATMLIGDSQTMTSEAAVLGTPAIRCNDFVGRIAYLEEEEHKYGLTYGFKPSEFNQMIIKIKELLNMPYLKQEWQKRRKKMLSDKIDVTAFMVWFIENYPASAKIMKENPDYQNRFK